MAIPEDGIEGYVRAALALQGYELDEAQTAAVVEQFTRIVQIAGAALREPLPPLTEPLPVFRP